MSNEIFHTLPRRLKNIILNHIWYYEDGRKEEILKCIDVWVIGTICDPSMNMTITRFCPQSYNAKKILATHNEIISYFIIE